MSTGSFNPFQPMDAPNEYLNKEDMKTHILIPIKDIEDLIKTFDAFQKTEPTEVNRGKRLMLKELLHTGKQISLDELKPLVGMPAKLKFYGDEENY